MKPEDDSHNGEEDVAPPTPRRTAAETTTEIDDDLLNEVLTGVEPIAPPKKSSAPPPLPEQIKRKAQPLSEVARRLLEQGWTNAQLLFECYRLEQRVNISLSIQAQFSYAKRVFEVKTALAGDCQSIVRPASTDGSSRRERIFTVEKILEQGRKEDRTIILALEERILEKLISLTERIRLEDGRESSISFALVFDLLTGHFSWQMKYISSEDLLQNMNTLEGSYALGTRKGSDILQELGEIIIRGIDSLYTPLGRILRHIVKYVIARDLTDKVPEEAVTLITHPRTEILVIPRESETIMLIMTTRLKNG